MVPDAYCDGVAVQVCDLAADVDGGLRPITHYAFCPHFLCFHIFVFFLDAEKLEISFWSIFLLYITKQDRFTTCFKTFGMNPWVFSKRF